MNTWVFDAAFLAVLSAVALGCATPLPPEYDAHGYPVDYAVPLHERYGVCSEERHPNCHAHSKHYRDEHGDKKVYRWEHEHSRRGMPAPAREQVAEVEPLGEGAENLASAPVPEAAAYPGADVADSPVRVVVDPVPEPARWVGPSRIIGVVARGEEIEVVAKGPIDNFDSFTLELPRRIVVDFWGAESEVGAADPDSDLGPVAEILITEHPGRVRLVLDLRETVRSHRVQRTATGAEILLNASGGD